MVIQPPDGRTLVNFETNFLTTTTEPTSQTVQLLGHGVEIEATPVNYLWHFGDGTSQEGSDPGAEYPDLRITHVYEKAGVTVSPSVDVTYQGRYRVDGGGWVPIPDTLTVAGTPAGSPGALGDAAPRRLTIEWRIPGTGCLRSSTQGRSPVRYRWIVGA